MFRGRRKAPGSVKASQSRPALRSDGSEKGDEDAEGFNVTVNAYDPMVHVYTGRTTIVNSFACERRPRRLLRRKFVDGFRPIVFPGTNDG